MAAENTKDLALSFIEMLRTRQFDLVPTIFHDDANYWVVGDPSEGIAWGGDLSASRRGSQLKSFFRNFQSVDVTEGLEYIQTPCFVFKVTEENGQRKVKELREYIDNHRTLKFMKALAEHRS
ncbi:hypothetical protein PROFUN_06761 [Planoprotostelium fungivorum]|uniref:SnoaL-like domain-containing protein n=1 Tax=Planoprotostelium fungivorum TaxID=1890364 RepID=A0A2P6NNJ3_9EUKA|nr:hypothetical protein PROFUN_06761 [Planoprotostelium fungivorum]